MDKSAKSDSDSATPHLRLSGLSHSSTSWGPTEEPAAFAGLPFAMFRKDEKLGKVADFGNYMRPYVHRRSFAAGEENVELMGEEPDESEARKATGFTKVDSSKGVRDRSHGFKSAPRTNGGRRQQVVSRDRAEIRAKDGRRDREIRKALEAGRRKRDKLSMAKHASRRMNVPRVKREASVRPLPSWTNLGTFELGSFKKLHLRAEPSVRDVAWVGELGVYDAKYEHVSRATRRPLRPSSTAQMFVPAEDDPVLESLVDEGEADVITSDAVLSHLMTSPLSVFPWDLRATVYCDPEDGEVVGIVLDAADPVRFERLTVAETAPVCPPESDARDVNGQHWLGVEATQIEHSFSQQSLKKSNVSSISLGPDQSTATLRPPPFSASDRPPARLAYRYRVFDLGPLTKRSTQPLRVGVRTRVHAVVPSTSESRPDELVCLHTLNEWDPAAQGASEESWRRKIDETPAAVFAGEIKNNTFKVAKWAAQAVLAGAHEMKFGFVSRTTPSDNSSHEILAAMSISPESLMPQLTLDSLSMWGVVKWLVTTLRKYVRDQQIARAEKGIFSDPEQGLDAYHFVLARKPNDPHLVIFSVPSESDLPTTEEDDKKAPETDPKESTTTATDTPNPVSIPITATLGSNESVPAGDIIGRWIASQSEGLAATINSNYSN